MQPGAGSYGRPSASRLCTRAPNRAMTLKKAEATESSRHFESDSLADGEEEGAVSARRNRRAGMRR